MTGHSIYNTKSRDGIVLWEITDVGRTMPCIGEGEGEVWTGGMSKGLKYNATNSYKDGWRAGRWGGQ